MRDPNFLTMKKCAERQDQYDQEQHSKGCRERHYVGIKIYHRDL